MEGRRAADAEQPGGAVNDGGKSLDVAFDASTEFPVIAACTYLNHAALAPWPRRTRDTVTRFAAESTAQGARHLGRWTQTERTLRKDLAQLVNAPSADDIALLKNTSEALSFVAAGFPWEAGDNLVIPYGEFPSNRIVWESLRERGVSVREVPLQDPLHNHLDPEDALIAAADSRTRLLSVSTVQYASGLRLDLVRLGEQCRARGIAFCVDAIQGLGALAHDVQAMHADFLMADAHKWLLGPEGIALFYCRAQWRERLRLVEFGWHMVEDPDDFDRREWRPAASARRFECGSPNRVGIHALAASLSLLMEIGIPEVERRVVERGRRLIEAIRVRRDLELVTPSAAGRSAGIVTFRAPRCGNVLLLWKHLMERNVVCAVRAGGIRFSPHFYVPLRQIDEAMSHVDDFIEQRPEVIRAHRGA